MTLHNSIIERIDSHFYWVQESFGALQNAIFNNLPGEENFLIIYLSDLSFYLDWVSLVDDRICEESHF